MTTSSFIPLITALVLARPLPEGRLELERPVPGERCFDFGPAGSTVADGYTPVTPADAYDRRQGFGWRVLPGLAFDDIAAFRKLLRGLPPNRVNPVPSSARRDGIEGPGRIVFEIDVPAGQQYVVYVTVGRFRYRRHDIDVSVNGAVVAEDIDCFAGGAGSQGGTPTRTVKTVTDASRGKVLIEISTRDRGNPEAPGEQPFWLPRVRMATVVSARLRVYQKAPQAEGLPRGSALRRALEAESRVTGFDTVERHEEIELLDRTIDAWLDVLSSTSSRDKKFRMLARDRLESAHRYRQAQCYVELHNYSTARKQTGLAKYERYWVADDLAGAMCTHDPLWFKSHLLRARVNYWNGREGGWKRCLRAAAQHVSILRKRYPEHRLVKLYSGERVPASGDFSVEAPGAPRWALYQREALARALSLIHFWTDRRQTASGELGGGWADDVEILRSWAPALLAVDDDTARQGLQRLADGVFASGTAANGYSTRLEDVEHAAEPVTDTQPLLLAVRYGDPTAFERCLDSVRQMRDVWTARTPLGHRHFRSHWFNATRVDDTPPRNADVTLNARAVCPGTWVVWYSELPEARQVIEQWCAAWVADAHREENGKPPGIIPGSISFPDDRIGGHAQGWWQCKNYVAPLDSMGYTALLYHTLLAAWTWSGDDSYLAPIHRAMELVVREGRKTTRNTPEGSEAWIGQIHRGLDFLAVISKWRLLGGDQRYDEYLSRHGPTYMRYRLTGDLTNLESRLEKLVDRLSHNIEFATSEVLFTDRVAMPDCSIVMDMMTGSTGPPTYCPVFAVTWENTHNRLAALVEEATPRLLKIQTYSFFPMSHRFGMRVWRLLPGTYAVEIDGARHGTVTVRERAEIVSLELPPRRLVRLTVTRQELRANGNGRDRQDGNDRPLLADPALARDSVRVTGSAPVAGATTTVSVIVHNIGAADTGELAVELLEDGDVVSATTVGSIAAPRNLVPKRSTARLSWTPRRHGAVTLEARIRGEAREISGQNNRQKLEITVE